MEKKVFETRSQVIKRIGLRNYIHSRLVTPLQIKEGIEDGPMNLKASKSIRMFFGNLLFNARYVAGKAVLGYDFN